MFYDAFMVITGVLALLFVLMSFKLLVRSGWVFGWIRGMGGVLFILLAGFFFLLALDIRHFSTYSEDKPIATISFEQQGPQTYKALLLVGDDAQPQQFQLNGDQWQLDARILRWSGVMRTIGGKPGYQLDRISGRYTQPRDEMLKERSVFALTQQAKVFDMWHWLYASRGMVPGVDAIYGSATYVPMADGALYQVGLSDSGLVASPLNDSAKTALDAW